MPAKPINYLGQSNLVTLLCCLPLGIVAIVYSSQVDTKYAKGAYDGAKSASELRGDGRAAFGSNPLALLFVASVAVWSVWQG